MLVYYFVPFTVSNRHLLFWVSNGHNSVTVQNRTHVYMNFSDHKDLGNHLLQLCPKVVKHPVYPSNINKNHENDQHQQVVFLKISRISTRRLFNRKPYNTTQLQYAVGLSMLKHKVLTERKLAPTPTCIQKEPRSNGYMLHSFFWVNPSR